MSLENFDVKKIQQKMSDGAKAILKEVRIEQKKFDGDVFERILSNKNLSSDEREYYLELKRKSDEYEKNKVIERDRILRREKDERNKILRRDDKDKITDLQKEVERLEKIVIEQYHTISNLKSENRDLNNEIRDLELDID